MRSDWHERGLGYRLIEVARQSGRGELVGEVLAENKPMLEIPCEFGFTVTANPNDVTVMEVRKSLNLN